MASETGGREGAAAPVPQELVLDQKTAEALLDLLKALAKLKESGFLDMLTTIAEKYEEALLYTSSDQRVYHALAMVEAALNGLKQADPWKYKPAVEAMTGCLVSALDPEEMRKAKPVKGVFSLMKALSDPNVARGLGLLIYLAGRLGACMAQQGQQG